MIVKLSMDFQVSSHSSYFLCALYLSHKNMFVMLKWRKKASFLSSFISQFTFSAVPFHPRGSFKCALDLFLSLLFSMFSYILFLLKKRDIIIWGMLWVWRLKREERKTRNCSKYLQATTMKMNVNLSSV
jgi:hypothetical protein